MDETLDEPPTSAVLLDNCHFSQVVFNNVEKFYIPGGDVTCYYTLTQNIVSRGKDWVGIFRVGWKTIRDYYTFLWAPLPSDAPGDTTVQQQVHFKAYYLPKDDEYYQFCYVDKDGMVRGASVPFQFRAETEDDILVVTTQGEVEETELRNKNLRKENEELKASCASLQKENIDLQEGLKKTQELQNSLESLRRNTEKLELELKALKEENKHLKELDDCRGAELHQLKEQIQNVTSDKQCLETRLKTALSHMDQLQGEVKETELRNKNLRKENEELKASCASLQKENIDLQEGLKKTQELQNSLESLRRNTEKLELELKALKEENKHLKELDDCRGAELHQLKEQIQNVTSDKQCLETRLKTALSHMDQLQGEVKETELRNKNLRKENEELKASCASLQKENIDLQEGLKKTQELQNSLESLRRNTEKLELELKALKEDNKHLKKLDDCRGAELHQLKEQIQNVTSDKQCLETRLKTALSHMDQLQSQLLNYEKEVEDLSNMNHKKTEQLEKLKEENRRLHMARTEQPQNLNLVKELEEQKHLFRILLAKKNEADEKNQQQNLNLMKELEEQKSLFLILQAEKNEADEKNQKLREENVELLRHLVQAREVSSSSAVSKAQAPIPAPEIAGLLFGNPYRGAGKKVEARAADAASIRKCPMCNEVFPEDIETSQYEAHVQSHLLECPLCSKSFEKSNKQVFDDHVFCHGLEF
ncbi:calcium-binding and coiled-coil domain-containing protein 2 isoform 2-T2 [Rhynochetos jubatus]